MFELVLGDKFPWETGVKPDASNDVGDLYVDSGLTKYIRLDMDRNPIKGMEKWYVGLMHFKDGDYSWIISDGIGVLEATKNLENIMVMCDKWKLVNGAKSSL
jgi:hypothetical protein